MSEEKEEMIPLSEAEHEVDLASRRIGMLHLAYARTLVDMLGEEKGKEAILASIKEYGRMVGEQTKEAVQEEGLDVEPENFGKGSSRTLPKFGNCEDAELISMKDGKKKSRVYGCSMGKFWREMGEEELGSLYCYVDAAKYMYYNSDYKLIHNKTMPITGGNCCEFEVKEVSEEEKELFFKERAQWINLDDDIALNERIEESY